MKKLFVRLMIGLLCGALIGNLFVMMGSCSFETIYTDELIGRVGSSSAALTVQTILSALIGGIGMGGMSLYDDTNLTIAQASVIHFVIIEAVFLPVSLFLGWISPSVSEILIMSACILVVFVLIWIIMYLYYKQKVRELNSINKKNKK